MTDSHRQERRVTQAAADSAPLCLRAAHREHFTLKQNRSDGLTWTSSLTPPQHVEPER